MSPKQTFLSLSVASALLACLPAQAGNAPEPAENEAQASAARTTASLDKITDAYNAQVRRAADALKTITPLSHEERLRAIAQLPAGTYVNLPEFWQSVETPAALLSAYWILSEPLSPDALDAAERLLPKATGSDRFSMIVALYRYRRPSGEKLLRANVKDHKDMMSAAVLAANHDLPALPDILATLKAYPSNFPLTPFLSTWRDPKVREALLETYKAHPDNTALAETLAIQRYRPALPVLQSAYRHIKGYPMGGTIIYGSNKTILGAILISFGAPESKPLLLANQKQLSDSIHAQTMDYGILTLIQAIGELQLQQLAPDLKAILKTYSSQSKADRRPWSEVLAITAAESLYACEHKKANPEIQELKRALTANFPQDDGWRERLQYSLSQIDAANLDPEDYLRLKGVRKVPHDLLPSVRSFAVPQEKD